MSSSKKHAPQDTHIQQLVQRLRCCRGLERMVEKDVRELDWAKQEKVFVMLFLRIGVKALHNCAAERLADKKPMSAAERRQVCRRHRHHHHHPPRPAGPAAALPALAASRAFLCSHPGAARRAFSRHRSFPPEVLRPVSCRPPPLDVIVSNGWAPAAATRDPRLGRQTEEAFQTVFQKLVIKHLQIAGYKGSISISDLLAKRRDFYGAPPAALRHRTAPPARLSLGGGTGKSCRESGEAIPACSPSPPPPLPPATLFCADRVCLAPFHSAADAIEFLLECDNQVPDEHNRADRPTVGKTGGGNPRTAGGTGGTSDGYRPMLNSVLAKKAAAEHRSAREAAAGRGGAAASSSGDDPDDEGAGDYNHNSGRQVRYLQLEMNRLKKENRQLRQEKRSVETLYQQLITEQRHEKYDARRVNVLKSQNIQLERQLALVQNALYQRRAITTELHGIMANLTDMLRTTTAEGETRPAGLQAAQAGTGDSQLLPSFFLSTVLGALTHTLRTGWVGWVSAAKVLEGINVQQEKLRKLHGQLANPSKLQQQLYYPNVGGAGSEQDGNASARDPGRVRPSFACPKNATIFVDDTVRMAVTDGAKVRHIDLEAVETLERVLGTLSPKLLALRQALCTISLPNMLLPGQERVAKLAQDCCTTMHRAAFDLTTLSTLLPTGPLGRRGQDTSYLPPPPATGGDSDNPAPLSPLPSTGDFMRTLPPSGPGQKVARSEIEPRLTALLQWVADREAWLQTVAESLGSELVFYTSSHTVQNEYITRLCKDVEERQLTNDDGSVMQDIINSFEAFELNTSEATLRTFLKVFKHHQQALQSVCDRLSKRLISHSMRKALEDLRRSYQAKYSGLLAKRLALMEQSTTSRSVFESALAADAGGGAAGGGGGGGDGDGGGREPEGRRIDLGPAGKKERAGRARKRLPGLAKHVYQYTAVSECVECVAREVCHGARLSLGLAPLAFQG
eukprot:SAG22_NODE_828_length_6952_cov_8.477240_5_plen_963_part_00